MRSSSPPEVVVLGLPRGGVPVAAEVARTLGAPLDVIVVRKVGVPWQPELAMGAVGESGTSVVNTGVVRRAQVQPEELHTAQAHAKAEVQRLLCPASFGAVGAFYDDFSPTSDDEVRRLLDQAAAAPRATPEPRTPQLLAEAGDDVVVEAGAARLPGRAADRSVRIGAVVSRGGRPELAGRRLAAVEAPTLLIVGSRDHLVLTLNRGAAARLRCPHRLAVVPGATHLFEEPGTLEAAARLATGWFIDHLRIARLEGRSTIGGPAADTGRC